MTIELIGTEPLYQWDTGREITISSSEYEIKEIHFSSKGADEALVVAVSEDMTANVPNILLQQTSVLYAYAVVRTENGRHSVYAESFKITKRAKPSDYVYAETEILRYEDLKERIAALEELGSNKITDDHIVELIKANSTKTSDEDIVEVIENYVDDGNVSYNSLSDIPCGMLPAGTALLDKKNITLYGYGTAVHSVLMGLDNKIFCSNFMESYTMFVTNGMSVNVNWNGVTYTNLDTKPFEFKGGTFYYIGSLNQLELQPNEYPFGIIFTREGVASLERGLYSLVALIDNENRPSDDNDTEILSEIRIELHVVHKKPLHVNLIPDEYDVHIVDLIKQQTPTTLSELNSDASHRTVSDTEKEAWNNKLDKTALDQAATDFLRQAKESGEFKGDTGKTAYEYAKEGGYTGTESEFAAKLAAVVGLVDGVY